MKFTNKNRAGLISGIVAAVLLSCAGPCFAQNVADAARQERDRKQHAGRHSYHVYTNEDLKRKHILVPEDEERALEARRNAASPAYDANHNSATPGAPATASGVAPGQPSINGAPQISLLPFTLPQPQAFGEFAPAFSAPNFAAKHFGQPAAPRVRRAHPLLDDSLILELQKSQSLPAAPEFPATPSVPHLDATHVIASAAPTAAPLHSSSPASPHADTTRLKTPAAAPVHPITLDARAQTTVRVQRGDSLWKIAAEHFGDGARWREIAVLNPEIADPNVIQVGESIRIAPDAQSARRFIVQPGDTLSSVAQAQFGNARAFTCIASANPNLRTADLIFPGQALVLPDTCPIVR